MNVNIRRVLSRTLIGAGCALILTALVYEAANYPWRSLRRDANEIDLPDPKPLDELEQFSFEPWTEDALPDEATPPPLVLPGSDTILSPAPAQDVPPAEAPSQDGQTPDPKPSGQTPDPKPGGQTTLKPKPKPKYLVLGTVKIPKLSVSQYVLEGSDGQLLAGVGHITGTALPGAEGNCALSGHRNYIRMHPFKHLNKLEAGDLVYVTFDKQRFTYTVYESFVVAPEDTWVLLGDEERSHILTLITCDPVINPVNRLIVRAELTGSEPLA